MRIAIVGGGVIGCAIADRLSGAGHKVELYERDTIGSHASGAAAGLLAPAELPGVSLASRSAALFPELTARLTKETGIDVQYRPEDFLDVAFDESEQANLEGQVIDGQSVRLLEPELSGEVIAAGKGRAAHLTPPLFVKALAEAARSKGAVINEGVEIDSLPDGFDQTVVAAGPWSAELARKLSFEVKVTPRRGQLIALRPERPLLKHLVTWGSQYIVSKLDGTVVAGTTEEDAGFDEGTTREGIEMLRAMASRVVPALASAPVERSWAALRPATPDGLPVIERLSDRVIVATGHNRNGILLAPITADLVADLIAAK